MMKSTLLILEENHLALHYSGNTLANIILGHQTYPLNDIYLGKISSILPSLNAAFITLKPSSKNGFIHMDNLRSLKKDSSYSIGLKRNDDLLVQITKEPTGNKGPSLSSDITIQGKYLSLFPFNDAVMISKLQNETDKDYLRVLGSLLKPRETGILLKSNSLYADMNFLYNERNILRNKWVKIKNNSELVSSPYPLSKKRNFIHKIFEELYPHTFTHIAVDSYLGALETQKVLIQNNRTPEQTTIIEFHPSTSNLVSHYSIDLVISEILKPRVNLAHGSYIVIEKTEALTTIDVNSGSFTHLTNPRDTIRWTNYSAADEIVKQLKLRNIGGIIIVDFIDSRNQEDQMKILLHLANLIKNDHLSSTIIQISELGLVEMTRTRQGQTIYDAFSHKCLTCNGLGFSYKEIESDSHNNSELLMELFPTFSNSIERKLRTLYN
jgi:ribonuclease E